MPTNYPLIRAFTATTTPQLLLRRNAKRKAVLIVNNGAVVVELRSPQGQGSGIPIHPAAAATGVPPGTYKNDHFNCQGEYWIVAASDTCDVRIEEDIQEE